MADVDTRLKRQSAMCILMPFMLSPNFPNTAGIVQEEWQASGWIYSGITAATEILPEIIKKFLLLGVGR